MKSRLLALVALAAVLCLPRPALAYLGSFESVDGYAYHPDLAGWIDVSYYDAGQYGLSVGGGPSPTAIAPSSGLWKITSQAGGFYQTSAVRNTQTAGAPPYPSPMGGAGPFAAAYIVGNHFGGRTGNALVLRNEDTGNGLMHYDYKFDQFDFGGISPASVTSGDVLTQFYFCPNPIDPAKTEKFIMSFTDSTGSTGVQIGYARDNEVYWRAGSAGPWTMTGILADAFAYDGFRVNVDLTNDDFTIEYFDFSASAWSVLANNVPLGAPMQDVTHLGWSLHDSVTGGVGGKNFFDDFTVRSTIPEPSSFALAGLAAAVVAVRRVRRMR